MYNAILYVCPGMVLNGGSNYDFMPLSEKAELIELKFCGKLPHGLEMSLC